MRYLSLAATASVLLLFALALTLGPADAAGVGLTPDDAGGNPSSNGPVNFESLSLEVETRTIVTSDEYLPPQGGVFLLFAARPITRGEIAALDAMGAHYFGHVRAYIYAFEARQAGVGSQPLVRNLARFGLAEYRPADRLSAELRDALAAAPQGELAVAFSLWSRTTRAEAIDFSPQAAVKLRLPSNPHEAIRADSILRISVAAGDLLAMAAKPCVAGVSLVRPRRELNAVSRALARTIPLESSPYNLDGSGVTVGIWDGAVIDSHNDFDTRLTVIDTGNVSAHSTHVAGTIAGSGAGNLAARGFAPGAKLLGYDFGGAVFDERRSALHNYQHLLDNHSWGADTSIFGGYNSDSQNFDLDARDLLMVAVKAAGNDGADSKIIDGGEKYDSLVPDSTGKNTIVVGNHSDGSNIASTSSRGPTNDGRLKPDIAANGDNLLSTRPNNSYGYSSGTSMATPSVSGALALIAQRYAQLYDNERLKPDTARALIAHCARDAGNIGPDFLYGWGILDAEAAVALLDADQASNRQRLLRGALRDGETVTYAMEVASVQSELKVTLSWLDLYGATSSVQRLINDLDLEIEDPRGFVLHPWTLDASQPSKPAVQIGKNDRDNLEQIVITNASVGLWKVRIIGARVGDPDLPVQGFVLASSHDLESRTQRVRANSAFPSPLLDGDARGRDYTFDASSLGGHAYRVRLAVDITHSRRGDLKLTLRSPSGQSVVLEANDTNTRDDLFAIYPDTRSFDDDVTVFQNQSVNGVWTLNIADVNNGSTGELRDAWIEFDMEPANFPPTAVASVQGAVFSHQRASLDGSGSFDPELGALTFAWTQTSGTSTTLENANTATPTFAVPSVAAPEVLVFELRVTDDLAQSDSTSVNLSVFPNAKPVAASSGDQSLFGGTLVALDGSASFDADGDALTFSWFQIGESSVELLGADSPLARFAAPLLAVTTPIGFTLIVHDSHGVADMTTVVITVSPPPPSAPEVETLTPAEPRAGKTLVIEGKNLSGATVTFDGLELEVVSSTASELQVKLPQGLASQEGGFIIVATANGSFAVPLKVKPALESASGGSSGGGGCAMVANSLFWPLLVMCAIWAFTVLFRRIRWRYNTE